MAESKRRGEDAADEHLDEVLDDAVDGDALDGDDRPAGSRKGATAVRSRSKRDEEKPQKAASGDHVGFFGRIGRFVREVAAELRKVIWPTRKELLTYAAVVVVFVAVMLTVVGLLDLGFSKAVFQVFGGSK